MTNPTPWTRTGPPSRKELRQHGRERTPCDICGRPFTAGGLKRHRVVCLAPGAAKLSKGHRECGIDGCTRMRPISGDSCYLHEFIRDVEAFDRLDRLTGTGRYKGIPGVGA